MKTTTPLSLSLAIALLLCGGPPLVQAQIDGAPAYVDYQGQVLDSAGAVLAPTTPQNYTMYFRLYDEQTAGNLIWSETQTVTVNKGAFSVRLGEGVRISGEPLTGANQKTDLSQAFNQKGRYLGLTVHNPALTAQVEIVPRLAFLSSPFSFSSAKSKEADSFTMLDSASNRYGAAKFSDLFTSTPPADSTPQQVTTFNSSAANWKLKETNFPAGVSVPVGGVIMWWGAGNALPAGFELCDGGLIPETSPLKKTGITKKPDLRDKFVKGGSTPTANLAIGAVTGGSNSVTNLPTGGTTLSAQNIPSLPVSAGELNTSAAGAHSHYTVSGPLVEDAEGGATLPGEKNPDSYFAMGDYIKAVDLKGGVFPQLFTNTAGEHTHSISGVVNRANTANTPHTHTMTFDNQPAFQALFYIIRVN